MAVFHSRPDAGHDYANGERQGRGPVDFDDQNPGHPLPQENSWVPRWLTPIVAPTRMSEGKVLRLEIDPGVLEASVAAR